MSSSNNCKSRINIPINLAGILENGGQFEIENFNN